MIYYNKGIPIRSPQGNAACMAHLFFCYAHNDYDRLLPIYQRIENITERMVWIDLLGWQLDATQGRK